MNGNEKNQQYQGLYLRFKMRTKKTPQLQYLEQVFSREDAVLKSLRHLAGKNQVEYMQISAYEGGIIQFLCHALRVQKAIELGTLYGYSTLMIARALPVGGTLFTLDKDKERQKQAQSLIQKDPCANKIHFLHGAALDTLQTLKDKGPFDMIFIDADKASYLDYLHWSNRNLKSGGLLVADNTFLFGAIYGEPAKEEKHSPKTLQVMKQFNQEVADEKGPYISTLIPTAEGLTVGIKK